MKTLSNYFVKTLLALLCFGVSPLASADGLIIVSPRPHSVLPGTVVEFTWDHGDQSAAEYFLWVGNKNNPTAYFSGSVGTATSYTLTTLPSHDETVYLKIWYRPTSSPSIWKSKQFLFVGNSPSPTMISPRPVQAGLPGASTTFKWTLSEPSLDGGYYLSAGSGPGSFEYGFSNYLSPGTDTYTLHNLPTDGQSQVHVRLWYITGGQLRYRDFPYTAADWTKPAVTFPQPNSRIFGSETTLTWNANGSANGWWVYVGRTPGQNDIASEYASENIVTVRTLPEDGSVVYVRLYYQLNGAWNYRDYEYHSDPAVTWSSDTFMRGPNGQTMDMTFGILRMSYHGENLVAYHELLDGPSQKASMWYTYYNGFHWENQDLLRTRNNHTVPLTGPPDIAEYRGKLYGVFQGPWYSGVMRWFRNDGLGWSEPADITTASGGWVGTSTSPALAVYQDKLYCLHQGRGDSGWMWVTSYDGNSWSDDQAIKDSAGNWVGVTASPTVAVYKDKLHCVREGRGHSGDLWHTSFDGHTWTPDHLFKAQATTWGAQLVVFNDKLYCIYERFNYQGDLLYCTYDGNSWSPSKVMVGADGRKIKASGTPGLGVYNELFCAYTEPGVPNIGRIKYTVGAAHPKIKVVHNPCNHLLINKKEVIKYPVGWIPYLGDWLRYVTDPKWPIFKYYDPADNWEVGVLVGLSHDRKLIGDRMYFNKCIEIDPNPSSEGHYSFVLTENSDILYAWVSNFRVRWESYTRHSEIAGGQPALCAGEFTLNGHDELGRLIIELNNSSGHYKPDIKCLKWVLDRFKELGLNTENTVVYTRNYND